MEMNKELMVSILLINLPGESLRMPEEHCGLAFLKAYLDRQGIETQILDAYALRYTLEETKSRIKKWMEISPTKMHFVGISPFVTSHDSFVKIGEYIKKINPECYVLAGGHYASLNRKVIMDSNPWLDAIIVGEGELTLLELIKRGIKSDIPGLYVGQDDNDFVFRNRIINLDELPFQSRYLSIEQLHGQPMAITTSRGCYGECSFCSISSFYKLNGNIKQTFRSASSVSEEIHQLVEQYGIKNLKIVDDNFFRNRSDSFLEELAEKISELKLSIRLSARPNDITPYRTELLKKMGVTIIGIGAESADEKSLEFFNKGIGIEASERAIEMLDNNDITCLVNYIMFNPIIDIDGVKKNLDFIKKYKDKAVFHRINSHLWIRSTDPLVKKLKEMKLCKDTGFPYVDCRYANSDVQMIMNLFDKWCDHNMKKYYKYADVLMAKGINGNEQCEYEYRKLLNEDVVVLEELINFCQKGTLELEGTKFIDECLLKDNNLLL